MSHDFACRIKSSPYSGSLTQWPPDPITRKIANKDGEAGKRSQSVSNSNHEQDHDRISI